MDFVIRVVVRVVIVCSLTVVFFMVPDGINETLIWSCLIVTYAMLIPRFIRTVRIISTIPSLMKIDLLFGLFYYVIFFFPYQTHVLGVSNLYETSYLPYAFAGKTNQAIVLATIGLIMFNLGFDVVARRSPAARAIDGRDKTFQPTPYGLFDWAIPVALFSLCGTYLLFGLRSTGEGRYTGTDAGGSLADGMALLISMLSIIVVGLISARHLQGARVSLFLWAGLALAIVWASRTLILGDRNTFLLFGVALIGGLYTYFFRASHALFLTMIVVAFLTYNMVEFARMRDDFSIEQLMSASLDAGASEGRIDNSFNITTISLRAGLTSVPERFDFGFGVYKLLGFAGIVPFIRGWLFEGSGEFATSSDLLTYVTIGPNRGWSVGTNVLFDVYIDFGVVGTIVILFVLGVLAGRVQSKAAAKPQETKVVVFYVMYLSLFAQLPRYALDFPIRMLVWTAVLFWVYNLMSSNLVRRESPDIVTI